MNQYNNIINLYLEYETTSDKYVSKCCSKKNHLHIIIKKYNERNRKLIDWF